MQTSISPVHSISYYHNYNQFLSSYVGSSLVSVQTQIAASPLVLPRSSSLPSQFGYLCKRAIIISTYKSIHVCTYPVAQISTSFELSKLHHSEIIRQAFRCCRSANVSTHRRLIQQRRSSHTCKSAQPLLTYSSAPFALLYHWLAKPPPTD